MADPVPWTFAAGGEFAEYIDALTDVLPAENGVEQRRGLRLAPRTALEFDGLEQGAERRHLEQLLDVNGGGLWWTPFWPDGGRLVVALEPAAGLIPVDTRWRRYRAGGSALLLGQDSRQWELVEIASVADDQLVLAAGPVQAWPAGTGVFPVARARLDGIPELSRFTGAAVSYRVRFRMEDPVDCHADPGPASYRGLPVLELPPDWDTDPAWSPARELMVEDNGSAAPAQYDPVGAPRPLLSRGYTLDTMARVAAFRSLVYALDGRRCPIWVPSLAEDFEVVANVSSGATALDVGWSGFSAWPVAEGRRDLRIELRDGTVLYRRITAAADLGNGVERLTLGASISPGFSRAQVALVSLMAPCRLDADTVVLRWWSHGVAIAELAFRGLRDGL